MKIFEVIIEAMSAIDQKKLYDFIKINPKEANLNSRIAEYLSRGIEWDIALEKARMDKRDADAKRRGAGANQPDPALKKKANKNKQDAQSGQPELDKSTKKARTPDDGQLRIGADGRVLRHDRWHKDDEGNTIGPIPALKKWAKDQLDLTNVGSAIQTGGRTGAKLMTPRASSITSKPSSSSIRKPK